MNRPEISPPLSAPKRSRRWLFWLIGPLTLLIVGANGIAVWSRDEPPPDVSDLIVVPRAIPDDQNAILLLSAAAARVDRSAWADDQDLFYDMSRGKNWNAAKATAWLAANEHVWPDVHRAASLPLSQAPIAKTFADGNSPPVGPLRELTQLASLRAWHLYRSGNREEAFASLAIFLCAGHGISNARSGLLIWLMGIAVNGMICDRITSLTLEGPISNATGQLLIATLDATRPTAAALADTIRNEHIGGKLGIEQIRHSGAPSFAGDAFDEKLAAAGLMPLLLKPNRTQRLHADMLRRTISRIDVDWPTLRAPNSTEDDSRGLGLQKWNPENRLGRALLEIVTPTLETLLEKRLRAQSAISATQALLAVRLYEIEHGSLPEKLSTLVPAYLPKIPLDYYDRAPIRYSREFRALWSVGKGNLSISTTAASVESSDVYLKLPPRLP